MKLVLNGVEKDTDKMNKQELAEAIQQLKDANADLRARTGKVTCRVSEKGALSLYGLGRFPITMYISQFDEVSKAWDSIKQFVEEHRAEFRTKGTEQTPAVSATVKIA